MVINGIPLECKMLSFFSNGFYGVGFFLGWKRRSIFKMCFLITSVLARTIPRGIYFLYCIPPQQRWWNTLVLMMRTGWWFGTFFIFPYIGNNHPNWRTHIFQRGIGIPPTRECQHFFFCSNTATSKLRNWRQRRRMPLNVSITQSNELMEWWQVAQNWADYFLQQIWRHAPSRKRRYDAEIGRNEKCAGMLRGNNPNSANV